MFSSMECSCSLSGAAGLIEFESTVVVVVAEGGRSVVESVCEQFGVAEKIFEQGLVGLQVYRFGQVEVLVCVENWK